jgi:nickel-dependent lactate racemase
MKISLPQLIWYENNDLEIDLPDSWDVEISPMLGAESPALTPEQLKDGISAPIGANQLRELAQGKKSAVIIFDDMTRPTNTGEIAPLVIEELLAGGIAEEEITFVCALGTHGALTPIEFRKKLGDLVEKFRVFNHNIYENCVSVGKTSRDTEMMINREVAEADLKIAIGCVTPHPQAGFSGGGKLILPGVAHIDSISHYHLQVETMDQGSTGMGKHPDNILRMEIDEAASLAGIDFMINVLLNGRGEAAAVFAGDLMAAHDEAVAMAKSHYATEPKPADKDLAVSNAFVKPNEFTIALLPGLLSLKEYTGTVVILANSPEGQVIHYLLGRWGRGYGGRQYPVTAVPESIRLIVMAPCFDRTFGDWFANPEVVTWTRSWPETLALLEKDFGPGTSAAVIPNGTMQYFR